MPKMLSETLARRIGSIKAHLCQDILKAARRDASTHCPEEVEVFALRKFRPRITGGADWTNLA